MEALLFVLDAVVLVLVMYWGLLDERRTGSGPAASPFRFVDNKANATLAREGRRRSRNAPGRFVPGAVFAETPPPVSAAAMRHAEAVRRRQI